MPTITAYDAGERTIFLEHVTQEFIQKMTLLWTICVRHHRHRMMMLVVMSSAIDVEGTDTSVISASLELILMENFLDNKMYLWQGEATRAVGACSAFVAAGTDMQYTIAMPRQESMAKSSRPTTTTMTALMHISFLYIYVLCITELQAGCLLVEIQHGTVVFNGIPFISAIALFVILFFSLRLTNGLRVISSTCFLRSIMKP